MFFAPDSLPRIKRSSSSIIGYNVYTSTQTLTIPKGATKAFIRMCGGGGGAHSAGTSASAAGGGGGYLEKFLTGISSGLTLSLTVGAAGTVSGGVPSAGGNTTIVSGSQSITTLTANGGAAGNDALGQGGTATSGDLNVQGGGGSGTKDITDTAGFAAGGSCPLGFGVSTSSGSVGSGNYGAGGAAYGIVNNNASGSQGVCIIQWLA